MTDYEALLGEARRRSGQQASLVERLADAVEALIEDRDGWRDAAGTYKASRDASDARAEALKYDAIPRTSAEAMVEERDALRARIDKVRKYADDRAAYGRVGGTVDSARIASDLHAILAEGVSDE